jgi:hypothetical protein
MRAPRRSRQSLALLRSCLASAAPRAIVVAALAVASGCASAPPSSTLIPIRPTEGARWVSAETVEVYGCGRVALVCSAETGRLTERRCRC